MKSVSPRRIVPTMNNRNGDCVHRWIYAVIRPILNRPSLIHKSESKQSQIIKQRTVHIDFPLIIYLHRNGICCESKKKTYND